MSGDRQAIKAKATKGCHIFLYTTLTMLSWNFANETILGTRVSMWPVMRFKASFISKLKQEMQEWMESGGRVLMAITRHGTTCTGKKIYCLDLSLSYSSHGVYCTMDYGHEDGKFSFCKSWGHLGGSKWISTLSFSNYWRLHSFEVKIWYTGDQFGDTLWEPLTISRFQVFNWSYKCYIWQFRYFIVLRLNWRFTKLIWPTSPLFASY